MREVHRTIEGVTVEIERLHFNKAVALVRELSNAAEAFEPRDAAGSAALRGPGDDRPPGRADDAASGRGAVADAGPGRAPGHDRLAQGRPARLAADTITVAVQVNGKRRAEISLVPGAAEADARQAALADPAVQRAMGGKPARRVIVVPDKIVNVVV